MNAVYYTLNASLPNRDKDLTDTQKRELIQRLAELDDTSKRVVVVLIAEHAKIHDEYVVDPETPTLPYGIEQRNSDVRIDLEKLPIALRWILWKFVSIGRGD
jgi:hypothetical protein